MIDLDNYRQELSDKCSTCGFCYEYCPVLAVSGNGSKPYGKQQLSPNVPLTRPDFYKLESLVSSCLLCKACFPSCFMGKTPDEVVLRGRAARQSTDTKLSIRNILFKHILPYPGRTALTIKLFRWVVKMNDILLTRWLRLSPIIHTLAIQAKSKPAHDKAARSPVISVGQKTVTYFQSCGFDHLLPQVRKATLAIFDSFGYKVVLTPNACCGLPPYANGDMESAKKMAIKNVELLEGSDLVVTECASCSSFLKKYTALLENDATYAEKAKALSERVRDMSEILQDSWQSLTDRTSSRMPERLKVTYHEPCHHSRYQAIAKGPREIIQSIPGVEFQELFESDWCCGGPGLYSEANSALSQKILARKLQNIEKTGASVVVTSCPACMMQLGWGIRQAGMNVEVVHINQLVEQCMTADQTISGEGQ